MPPKAIHRLFGLRTLWPLPLLALWCPDGFAITFKQSDEFILPPDAQLEEELWLSAHRIALEGDTSEQVYLYAETIELTGAFADDVWAAGSTINVSGALRDHVRLLATKTVHVSGSIGRSLFSIAGTIKLEKQTQCDGDIVLFGEHIIADGTMGGNVYIMAKEATIGGSIQGSLRVVAEDIVVMPGTRILGDLVYSMPKELIVDDKVEIGGILKDAPAPWLPGSMFQFTARQYVAIQCFLYLCALPADMVFIILFPKTSDRSVILLRNAGWKCLLTGSLTFVLMPVLVFFTFFTYIGIPLSLIMLGLYLILAYLAKIAVALALGRALLRRDGPQPLWRVFITLSIGLVFLYILSALPMLGTVVWLSIIFLGMGALILSLLSTQVQVNPGGRVAGRAEERRDESRGTAPPSNVKDENRDPHN